MNLGYLHEIAASLNAAIEPVPVWKHPWDTFTLPAHIAAKCYTAWKISCCSGLCLDTRVSEDESSLGSETVGWREFSDGETKKPGCSYLKKCREGVETGAEDRNRRASFYSKGAIFTSEDKRKLAAQDGESEIPWSMVEAISCSESHLRITDQNPQKTQEWWTLAWSSILLFLLFHLDLCVSCTSEVKWRTTTFSIFYRVRSILHFYTSLKE